MDRNRLFTGDCLYIMDGLDSDSVDLVYLDPPFNKKEIFSAPIGSKAAGLSFTDMWSWDDVDKVHLDKLIENYPYLVQFIQSVGVIHSEAMKSYLTYMAQRLIEIKRILKNKGSLYFHCDPTASHYLKIICDRIFSHQRFKAEITWKRNSSHNDSKSFGNVSDIILFYGENIFTDKVRVPLNSEYQKKFYRHDDPQRGKFRVDNLSAKGLSGGGYHYDFHGHNGPWRYPEKRMLELENDNRIYIPKKINGVPALKRFLKENKGQIPTNVWTDVPPIQSQSKERTGYPTQKPIALMNRIINASSKEGDIVLDPFCGTATTCVAAQQLGRKWIGIDVSQGAKKLIIERLSNDAGFFSDFDHFDKAPVRKDIEEVKISNKTLKPTIFKNQNGQCNACNLEMDIRHFEIDHIIPKSKGGRDTFENYQLLCGSCNRIKGDRPMAYLEMKIDKMEKLSKHKISFSS